MADYHLVPVDHNPFESDWPSMMAADPRYQMQPTQANADAAPISESDVATLRRGMAAASPRAQMEREMERGGEITRDFERWRNNPELHARIVEEGARALPGVSPAIEAARGNYSQAVEEGALQALPYGLGYLGRGALTAGMAAYGAGSVMSPGATAGGLIDSLPENERAMYADQLKQANRIRDPDAKRAAVAAVNAKITERATSLRDEERRLAKDQTAAAEWLTNNADSIKSLPELQRAQIHGANPGDRPGLLRELLKQKEEAGKTFAERHAPEFEVARGVSALAGVGLPALQRFRQVSALERATGEAREALAAASKGRLTKAATTNLDVGTRTLRENLNLPSGASEFAKELGYGSLLPYGVATFAPNALEAMGRFATGKPEDREVAMRALGNLADPWSIGVSGGEGALATLIGQFLGRNLKNAGVAEANARGLLGTLTAAESKKAAALEKAAATRAANRAKRQEADVVNGGSLGAATAPAPAPRSRRKPSP